jgi:hypothetical protein
VKVWTVSLRCAAVSETQGPLHCGISAPAMSAWGHKQTFGSRPPWSAYPHKQTSTDAIGMFEGTVAAAPDISAISVPIPCSLKNFP